MAARRAPRVVILGSGWGGFRAARQIDKVKNEVTLISPANHTLFTPLLPSTAVGTLEFRCIQEPVRRMANVGYLQAKAVSMNHTSKTVTCADIFKERRFDVQYDKLILALGAKSNTFGIPGVAEREGKQVFFLKQLFHARQIRNKILELFERADMPFQTLEEKQRLLRFVVVGGGPTSCEFTSELYDFLTEDMGKVYPDLSPLAQVILVEAGSTLLSPFHASIQQYTSRLFSSRPLIQVRTNTAVKAIQDVGLDPVVPQAVLATGPDTSETLTFGMMVWSTGMAPVKFVDALNLPMQGGRIVVDDHCRVPTMDDVFAIGDCAINPERPLPQLAQVAMQQGMYVGRTINRGAPSGRFEYYSLGAMVSLGDFKGGYDGSKVGNPFGKQFKVPMLKGIAAWLMWRGAYLARQVSLTNMILIPMHWFKTWAFGRDISRF